MMSILFILVNLLLIIFFSLKLMRWSVALKKSFWPALSVKLLAGIILGLLYTFYYTVSDSFGFFEDATKLADLARNDLVQYFKFLWHSDNTYSFWSHLNVTDPRSLFFSKIISFFCLLTRDNYWITALYFSLISFACAWWFVVWLIHYYPELKVNATLAFLFVPSVVFWSSGLIKECLAVGGLFFLSGVAVKLWFRSRISVYEVLLSAVAIVIVWKLKYYYAALFLPFLFSAWVARRLAQMMRTESAWVEIALFFLILIFPFTAVSLAKENFNPAVFLQVIVNNYNEFHRLSSPGDVIYFSDLEPTILSVIRHAPWAVISGLFRPFIWEADNPLKIMLAVENALLLVLLLVSFRSWPRLFSSPQRLMMLAMVCYIITSCIFLTLSTPNFGTLSRYRTAFLPYLFFILSIDNPLVIYIEKIRQTLYSCVVRK